MINNWSYLMSINRFSISIFFIERNHSSDLYISHYLYSYKISFSCPPYTYYIPLNRSFECIECCRNVRVQWKHQCTTNYNGNETRSRWLLTFQWWHINYVYQWHCFIDSTLSIRMAGVDWCRMRQTEKMIQSHETEPKAIRRKWQ